jgi:hypothetical protein
MGCQDSTGSTESRGVVFLLLLEEPAPSHRSVDSRPGFAPRIRTQGLRPAVASARPMEIETRSLQMHIKIFRRPSCHRRSRKWPFRAKKVRRGRLRPAVASARLATQSRVVTTGRLSATRRLESTRFPPSSLRGGPEAERLSCWAETDSSAGSSRLGLRPAV